MAKKRWHGDQSGRENRKRRPLPPTPTHHPPGSPGKIAVMAHRDRMNWLLFHPLDNGMPTAVAIAQEVEVALSRKIADRNKGYN